MNQKNFTNCCVVTASQNSPLDIISSAHKRFKTALATLKARGAIITTIETQVVLLRSRHAPMHHVYEASKRYKTVRECLLLQVLFLRRRFNVTAWTRTVCNNTIPIITQDALT